MRPPVPSRAALSAFAEERDVELIFFDPPDVFDPAIVGIVWGLGQEMAVLYDEEGCIAGLIASGMEEDEAREWFDYNTSGAYLGEATPRFLVRPPPA